MTNIPYNHTLKIHIYVFPQINIYSLIRVGITTRWLRNIKMDMMFPHDTYDVVLQRHELYRIYRLEMQQYIAICIVIH